MDDNVKKDLDYCKKPLSKSITIRCIAFILMLCLVLGIAIYFSYKKVLYKRYEAYITDILTYVDSYIDDDDLANCIETLERSDEYDKLELFMDGLMNNFNIHYLYILKPVINDDGEKCFLSVVCAEDYYNRYVDTEGNLYLGWTSTDEYDEESIDMLFEIMKQKEIAFYTEDTEWGLDYTGALPLYNSDNVAYAVLAVDVNISDISTTILQSNLKIELIIIIMGIAFTIMFLYWTQTTVTTPIHKLERGVVSYVNESHHEKNIENLEFENPNIHTENEVESLTNAMLEMSADIKRFVIDLLAAEKKADQLSSLANKDSLTGIRNKTAYDEEIKRMEMDLSSGDLNEFGFAMIDLNFLKKINDTYGHEKGNISIKKLSVLVCNIFKHSPVFRIGGDEFIAILKGSDYENRNDLVQLFKDKLIEFANDTTLDPWDKISAAIGIAIYDKNVYPDVESVFKAADENMYKNKKEMKANRE